MATIRTAGGTENYKSAVCAFGGLRNRVRRRCGCADEGLEKSPSSSDFHVDANRL